MKFVVKTIVIEFTLLPLLMFQTIFFSDMFFSGKLRTKATIQTVKLKSFTIFSKISLLILGHRNVGEIFMEETGRTEQRN